MWQPRRRQKKSRRRRLPLMWRLCAQRWSVKPPHPPKGCSWLITLFNSHPWQAVYEPVAHFWLCSQVGRFGGVLHSLFFQILPSPPPSISLSLSLFIPCHALPLCHRLVCLAAASHHLLQAVSISLESPLLFSESDSFSAALSSPLSSSPPPTFPLSRCSSPPPPSSSHIHASFYSSLLSLSLYFIYFFLF